MARPALVCLIIVASSWGCDGRLDEAGTPVEREDAAEPPSTRLDAGAPGSSDAATSRDAAAPSSGDADGATADGAALDASGIAPCGCLDGPGTYCESDVAARARAAGCATAATEGGTALLACEGDATWSTVAACDAGCTAGETGASAECELPICDCFVRVSWCGASAARHALGFDVPCRIPLLPAHDGDILGCDAAGEWTVLEPCELGCAEMPTGTPDACVSTRSPDDPGWPDCAHRSLLHHGLHPEASDRLRCAGVSADRISQTIGSAAASAGYHASDGTADGMAYTAAVDLRTRDLSTSEIRALLERLGTHGFAAWYRDPGSDGWPSGEAPHIHAVFAGVEMKSQLRGQVRDFLVGRNGLASHTAYTFWHPSAAILDTVRLLFSRHYTP